MPYKAGYTFATNPWYIHTCNSGYGYAHCCLPASGGYGYMSESTCVKVNDPFLEPRNLYTHTGTPWIRLNVYKSGNPAMKFDLKQLTVLGSNPIQLWVKG